MLFLHRALFLQKSGQVLIKGKKGYLCTYWMAQRSNNWLQRLSPLACGSECRSAWIATVSVITIWQLFSIWNELVVPVQFLAYKKAISIITTSMALISTLQYLCNLKLLNERGSCISGLCRNNIVITVCFYQSWHVFMLEMNVDISL